MDAEIEMDAWTQVHCDPKRRGVTDWATGEGERERGRLGVVVRSPEGSLCRETINAWRESRSTRAGAGAISSFHADCNSSLDLEGAINLT